MTWHGTFPPVCYDDGGDPDSPKRCHLCVCVCVCVCVCLCVCVKMKETKK